jgi:predicted O-methyltransferase YrrM
MFFDFLKYYIQAGNAHSIHSPFVFELYTKVYKDFHKQPEFAHLEERRKALKSDQRELQITDYGAGSNYRNRKVSDVARHALKSPFWAQFFFRLIRYYEYKEVLELGTSLGLTTAYMAKAGAEVHTLEGCANTLQVAKEGFTAMGLDSVQTVPGNIDQTLMLTLEEMQKVDLALLDANHRYEPTLRYFNACYKKISANGVIIFDDIYWSSEMKKAWKEICADPRVSISIDFFHVGLVFFRKGVEKQHFVLR